LREPLRVALKHCARIVLEISAVVIKVHVAEWGFGVQFFLTSSARRSRLH
jgi:hypothetical protein